MCRLGICYMLDRHHWRAFNINCFINDPLGSDFVMTPGRSMHLYLCHLLRFLSCWELRAVNSPDSCLESMRTWDDCGRMLAAVLSNLPTAEGPHSLFQNVASVDHGLTALVRKGRTLVNHVYPCYETRPFLKFILLYVNSVLPLPEYRMSSTTAILCHLYW